MSNCGITIIYSGVVSGITLGNITININTRSGYERYEVHH